MCLDSAPGVLQTILGIKILLVHDRQSETRRVSQSTLLYATGLLWIRIYGAGIWERVNASKLRRCLLIDSFV